ncbi:nmrA-like family domain-containing protein 1 [Branchiostoma lanceolatum]|uniref:nmrA-like family domain-containing protein 1 n=1 Tax=Branchiostoma lanceolatum TaxID=7740 RepID=UPI003456F416
MAKDITVFGATGAQGGGVANALLEDSDFEVRVVTRSASSVKAQALQERGAEVVQASYDDPCTLGPALRDAHGTFVVTNYWEHRDFDRAVKQGKAVADAAKAAGVQHVVFSTLEHVHKMAGFPVLHFDSKALIEEYMTSLDLPTTFVKYPFFYENYLKVRKIRKLDDGTYEIGYPMEGAALDGASVADLGFAIRAIFRNRDQWLHRSVGFSADKLTIQQHAEIMSKHLAPKVFKATEMTAERFCKLGFPGAEELGNGFKFCRIHSCERSGELTRQLYPAVRSFHTWVADNKEALLNTLD